MYPAPRYIYSKFLWEALGARRSEVEVASDETQALSLAFHLNFINRPLPLQPTGPWLLGAGWLVVGSITTGLGAGFAPHVYLGFQDRDLSHAVPPGRWVFFDLAKNHSEDLEAHVAPTPAAPLSVLNHEVVSGREFDAPSDLRR